MKIQPSYEYAHLRVIQQVIYSYQYINLTNHIQYACCTACSSTAGVHHTYKNVQTKQPFSLHKLDFYISFLQKTELFQCLKFYAKSSLQNDEPIENVLQSYLYCMVYCIFKCNLLKCRANERLVRAHFCCFNTPENEAPADKAQYSERVPLYVVYKSVGCGRSPAALSAAQFSCAFSALHCGVC